MRTGGPEYAKHNAFYARLRAGRFFGEGVNAAGNMYARYSRRWRHCYTQIGPLSAGASMASTIAADVCVVSRSMAIGATSFRDVALSQRSRLRV
jgi:hypothetical protein